MSNAVPRRVTDVALARRLERSEGATGAAFVDARAAIDPALGALWRDFGGTYAMFDGVGSPLTQTFGLGLFSVPSERELAEIEEFFHSRGAEVHHEVSPLADAELLILLPRRGYHPFELSTVLHRALATGTASDDAGADRVTSFASSSVVTTRRMAPDESDRWAELSALGWGHAPELAAFLLNFGRITAASRGVVCFMAELDGEAIATGAVALQHGVALLAGASTRPEWRGRGAQTALLQARLAHAAEQGCDLAMMVTAPGSTSQMNAERQGFSIAYTRTKWRQAYAPGPRVARVVSAPG